MGDWLNLITRDWGRGSIPAGNWCENEARMKKSERQTVKYCERKDFVKKVKKKRIYKNSKTSRENKTLIWMKHWACKTSLWVSMGQEKNGIKQECWCCGRREEEGWTLSLQQMSGDRKSGEIIENTIKLIEKKDLSPETVAALPTSPSPSEG